MLKNLPIDIINQIKLFLYVKCDECKKEILFNEKFHKITTIYYKYMFDDEFPFPRIHKFYENICEKCIDILNINEDVKPIVIK